MTRVWCVLWLLGFGECAQSESLGVMTGRVLRGENMLVASSKVIVEQEGKEIASVVTGSDGRFLFELEAGVYVVRDGDLSKAVTVVRGKTTQIDLNLNEPPFFDEPQFTVAGVTDNTYRGGHGSDAVLRSSETLTKATASLNGTEKGAPEKDADSLATARQMQLDAERDPSEPNLFNWGTELLSHRAAQAAVKVFRAGQERYPKSTRMLLGLASAWYALGNYAQATALFFQAADLRPEDPVPYAFLHAAQATQVTQAAGYRERLARNARLHPESALAQYCYGFYLSKTDPAQAETFLQKAVLLDARLAEAFLQLGIVDAAQGRKQEAMQQYQKAVGLNFDLAEAHYRLAELYRSNGQRDLAAQELATYQAVQQKSDLKMEKERREVRQFVIGLRKAANH